MTTTPTHEALSEATVALLSALLDSASSDVIGAANWWPRAEAALSTSAAGASTVGEAVTIAARNLQIDTTAARTDAALAQACEVIAAGFSDWQSLMDREAVYLIALTRIHRQARKAAG